jgi:transketolase
MVAESLDAADKLADEGIDCRIINVMSIKPLDEETIRFAALETGALVTAEDHNCYGGLGSAIAEFLALNCPTPLEQIALKDVFAESGEAEELRRLYHLSSLDICEAVKRVIARKEAK